MSRLVEESAATPEVQAIYAEIKAGFGLPFVPNLFKAMAHHPGYLRSSWDRVKTIMGQGRLDRRTKEIIALAVSATNGCEYCIDAHDAAVRGLGLGDPEIAEIMAVVDLFNGFNRLAEGLRLESDLKA